MGLILDSSAVIAAERRGETVAQLLQQIASLVGDQQAAISAIGLTELVHAVYRAQTSSQRTRRERFVQNLLLDVEVVPFSKETALLAGKLDGEQRSRV